MQCLSLAFNDYIVLYVLLVMAFKKFLLLLTTISTPVTACDFALLLFQTDEYVSFVFTYINPLLVIPSLLQQLLVLSRPVFLNV